MIKPLKITNDISWASIQLDVVRWNGSDEASPRAAATGFLWGTGDEFFLVTNIHNLTGWDHARGEALSERSLTPNQVHVWLSFPDLSFAVVERVLEVESFWSTEGRNNHLLTVHRLGAMLVAIYRASEGNPVREKRLLDLFDIYLARDVLDMRNEIAVYERH